MSLNYDFKVKTNLSPKEMLKIAAKVHKTEINEQYDSFRILGAGVGAINYTPEIVTEWGVNRYLESYGFFPNVDVHFSQSLKDKFEISQRNIAKSVAELFKKTKDRAVFLFNDDKTIAQRLNGDLIEIHIEGDEDYPDYYDWLVEEFDNAGLKYVRKVLPSPLQM